MNAGILGELSEAISEAAADPSQWPSLFGEVRPCSEKQLGRAALGDHGAAVLGDA